MIARKKIAAWINNKNITQTAAGEMSGVEQPKLSAIIAGKIKFRRLDWAIQIVNAMRVSGLPGATLDWLTDDEQDWPPPEQAVALSQWELKVLGIIRDSFGTPGPAWQEAIDRLALRGDYSPAAHWRRAAPGPDFVATGLDSKDLDAKHSREAEAAGLEQQAIDKLKRKGKGRA